MEFLAADSPGCDPFGDARTTTGWTDFAAAPMPSVLRLFARSAWLAGKSVALDPYPAVAMHIQPVRTLVNRTSNDDPDYIEPIRLS